jgi:tetratricopeptide (TPR) repeat protein
MPDGLAARQDMFRFRLAHKRILVVLDNAHGEAELEPLLPGTGSCAVLVTSRYRLTALPGAAIVELDALAAGTALDLLSTIVGAGRIQAEQGAAARLVELCGGLPLAIRVAGARLAAKTHWSIAHLVARLADERLRLDEPTYRHLEVRASIALSYHEVDPAARGLLRLLGLVDFTDLPSWAAARLSGTSVAEAEEILERLVDARLAGIAGVDQTGQTRYRLHDLVRLFAREQAHLEESEQGRAAALERMLATWLGTIELVCERAGSHSWPRGDAPRLAPEPSVDIADPLRWFDAERLHIPSVLRLAADAPNPDLCWELALGTSNLFHVRNDFQGAIGCLEQGLAYARKAGNQRAQTMLLIQIGQFEYRRQRFEQAGGALARARLLAQELAEPRLCGLVTLSLGTLNLFQARYQESLAYYRQAHELLAAVEDPIGVETTRGIGSVLLRLGHPDQAEPYLAEAMAFARRLDNVRVLRTTLHAWAELRLRQGRLDEAEAAFSEVLRLKTIRDELVHQVRALYGLGRVRVQQGRGRVAAKMLSRAAWIAVELGLTDFEAGALASLAEAHVQFGEVAQAVAFADRAVGLARRVHSPHTVAVALIAKAGVLSAAGRELEGRACLKEADEVLAALGVSVSLPSWAGAGL